MGVVALSRFLNQLTDPNIIFFINMGTKCGGLTVQSGGGKRGGGGGEGGRGGERGALAPRFLRLCTINCSINNEMLLPYWNIITVTSRS